MDPPPSDALQLNERPKPPSFFRLLARNASKNKQGLAVVMLATSCLFLSMSMLDHKRRFDQLQEHYMSLKIENEELKQALGNVTDIVFEASQPPPAPHTTIKDSPAALQTEGKGFMV